MPKLESSRFIGVAILAKTHTHTHTLTTELNKNNIKKYSR